MKKDLRWKIWFFIPEDVKALMPTLAAFFQSDDLIYDYENTWEWVSGYSRRFKTNFNLSRRHDQSNSIYDDPLMMLTDFSNHVPGALEATEEIALAIAEEFSLTIYYGWAVTGDSNNSSLKPVGQFQRPQVSDTETTGQDETSSVSRLIISDDQDRSSEAWKKLCEYIDHVSANNLEEFIPLEALGQELFAQIKTLPASIGKLTQVTKVQLYGSSLEYIPPKVGKMKAMQYFDPYTSYSLHWLPYEITRCRALIDSRMSTRALYGNYKNRLPFPDLRTHIIKYEGSELKCSVCEKKITYDETDQFWISLSVGTDVLPLLVNACSKECVAALPRPPKGYLPWPHKGGEHLAQPLKEEEIFLLELQASEGNNFTPIQEPVPNNKNDLTDKAAPNQLIRLIRKIWNKD